MRDSAQYSRTDPFNLEQLELVSGANSVYTGAGSVGGSINLVTKTPQGMSDTVLDVAGGNNSYARRHARLGVANSATAPTCV